MNKLQYISIPVVLPVFFSSWPLAILGTAVVWGEARGESFKAKVAVAWVIQNRVDANTWYGKTHKEVILRKQYNTVGGKYQFSTFNETDPNSRKLRNPLKYDSLKTWVESWRAWEGVITKKFADPTFSEELQKGATHYHSISNPKKRPYWAKKLAFLVQIGNLYFYREK